MSTNTTTLSSSGSWAGGKKPYKASYGKLMMWFFLISDAFTFSTFLISYGVIRFSSGAEWANPEEVFTHFPVITEIFHIHPPLAFVGLMTFILIASSVTMVLAVEAGHRMDRKTVEKFMLWTIAGGVAFLSCQAYEWWNFINGTEFGALWLPKGTVVQLGSETIELTKASVGTLLNGVGDQIMLNTHKITGADALALHDAATSWVRGAGLNANQYSQNPSFANLFFFITGFHGTHVASGVFLNYIVYRQTQSGELHSRGHYEMVEKVGLYWHFVDLVWVFVFTFFYLI